jgi:glutathione S-transferase
MIPTFVDGDVVLSEASAIMIYLAEKLGSDLLPTGGARYQTLKWMFWAAEHFRYGPPILIDERFFKKIHHQPESPWAIEFADASIRKHSAVLDAHLKGRRFVLGDRLTLADFDLAAPFSHVPRTQAPFHEFPHLSAWHQRMLDEVPAWRTTRDQLEIRIKEIRAAVGLPPE